MSFTPEMLRARLTNSNESADSITSTAQWILFHKRQATAIANEWAQYLQSNTDKLSPIYIANEVIQQSKFKRRGEFVDAFAPVLPGALAGAYAVSNLATRDRIVRVVKVWRDRAIFSPQDQQNIEAALAKRPEVPAELVKLVQLFTDLKASPSAGSLAPVQAELQNLASVAQTLVATKAAEPARYTVQDAVASGGGAAYANESDEDIGYAPE